MCHGGVHKQTPTDKNALDLVYYNVEETRLRQKWRVRRVGLCVTVTHLRVPFIGLYSRGHEPTCCGAGPHSPHTPGHARREIYASVQTPCLSKFLMGTSVAGADISCSARLYKPAQQCVPRGIIVEVPYVRGRFFFCEVFLPLYHSDGVGASDCCRLLCNPVCTHSIRCINDTKNRDHMKATTQREHAFAIVLLHQTHATQHQHLAYSRV